MDDDEYGFCHSDKKARIHLHDNSSSHNLSSENGGRWSKEEHQLFLQGMMIHGREWKKVQEMIKTRTSAQIRSHAQKYFQKITKAKESSTHSNQSSLGEDAVSVLEYFDYLQESLTELLSQSNNESSSSSGSSLAGQSHHSCGSIATDNEQDKDSRSSLQGSDSETQDTINKNSGTSDGNGDSNGSGRKISRLEDLKRLEQSALWVLCNPPAKEPDR